MANLDQTGAGAQQGVHPQDAQLLANLLGNLLPLLQRIQVTGWTPASLGQAPHLPDTQQIDQQAAVAMAEDITADSLSRLSAYCERHAGQHPALDACVGIVTHAARSFAAADYNSAMALVLQAYRLIAAARATNAELPPLREAASAASVTSH